MTPIAEGTAVTDKTCHVATTERRLMLFAGRSNPQLSENIAEHLGIRLAPVLLKTFANGEIYARYEESMRDADVFLVQSPHGLLNEHVMELLIMIQAAKLASAHRITAVLPYFPYCAPGQEERRARADHRPSHGDAARGRRRRPRPVDGPPSGPGAGLLRDPRRPHDRRADARRLLPLQGLRRHAELVAVSADAGGVKLAKRFANRIDGDLAVLTKMRPEHNVAETMHFIGDVDGKIAIVVDDMIDTGRLGRQRSRHALRARRPRRLRDRHARHLLGTGPRAHRGIARCKEVVVTDTLPVVLDVSDTKIKVLSVAGILADTIKRVFEGESVSELFAGENALF